MLVLIGRNAPSLLIHRRFGGGKLGGCEADISLKPVKKMTKPNMPSTRRAPNLQFFDPNADLFLVGSKETFIQWPTEREIRGISAQLARIQRAGIRLEARDRKSTRLNSSHTVIS